MEPRIARTVLAMKSLISRVKSKGLKVGFVPTMGALHEGHASLYNYARNECDFLVGSIYANPTQFDNKKDLDRYPRTIESDLKLLKREKVDLVYLAESEDVYHNLEVTKIDFGTLTETLEQINVLIKGHPIKREKDGLAMSSRNRRLSEREYRNALVISKAIFSAPELKMNRLDPSELEKTITEKLVENMLKPDYVKIVESNTLKAAETFKNEQEYRILIAAYSGETRLIDNGAL